MNVLHFSIEMERPFFSRQIQYEFSLQVRAFWLKPKIINKIGTTENVQWTRSVFSEIKTRLTNGIDLFEQSLKPVSEWCTVQAIPLLRTYKDGDFQQPDNLLQALNDWNKISNDAQKSVFDSKRSINTAYANLYSLTSYLKHQFNETNVENVSELNEKVASIREFLEDLVDSKNKILVAIQEIGDLGNAAAHVSTYVSLYQNSLRDVVSQSVDNLIEKCNNYRSNNEWNGKKEAISSHHSIPSF